MKNYLRALLSICLCALLLTGCGAAGSKEDGGSSSSQLGSVQDAVTEHTVLLTDQDEILHGFYSTVVEKFGIDHAAQLISLLREFDQIVKDEKKSLEHT